MESVRFYPAFCEPWNKECNEGPDSYWIYTSIDGLKILKKLDCFGAKNYRRQQRCYLFLFDVIDLIFCKPILLNTDMFVNLLSLFAKWDNSYGCKYLVCVICLIIISTSCSMILYFRFREPFSRIEYIIVGLIKYSWVFIVTRKSITGRI